MFYGLDVHKQFIQVCAVDADGEVRSEYRIDGTRAAILAFGATIRPDDSLVLEATFHTWAIHNLLVEAGARVVVANPMQVKAIAHARVKTDKVDARTLAQLLREQVDAGEELIREHGVLAGSCSSTTRRSDAWAGGIRSPSMSSPRAPRSSGG